MGIKINLQKFTSMKNEQHQRSIVQYYHFSTNYPQSSTLFIRCINKKKNTFKKSLCKYNQFYQYKIQFPQFDRSQLPRSSLIFQFPTAFSRRSRQERRDHALVSRLNSS